MHGGAEDFKYLKSLSSTTTFYLVLISLLFWKLCKRLIFWTFNLFLLVYNFFFVKNFRIIFSLRFWMLWKKLMHLVLSLSLSRYRKWNRIGMQTWLSFRQDVTCFMVGKGHRFRVYTYNLIQEMLQWDINDTRDKIVLYPFRGK